MFLQMDFATRGIMQSSEVFMSLSPQAETTKINVDLLVPSEASKVGPKIKETVLFSFWRAFSANLGI